MSYLFCSVRRLPLQFLFSRLTSASMRIEDRFELTKSAYLKQTAQMSREEAGRCWRNSIGASSAELALRTFSNSGFSNSAMRSRCRRGNGRNNGSSAPLKKCLRSCVTKKCDQFSRWNALDWSRTGEFNQETSARPPNSRDDAAQRVETVGQRRSGMPSCHHRPALWSDASGT